MILSLFIIFVVALISAFLPYRKPRLSAGLIALAPLVGFLYFCTQISAIAAGHVVLVDAGWVSQLGVRLSFRLDGLSLLFSLLITGMGTVVVIYSGSYLQREKLINRYFLYLLLFIVAMLACVLADNLITLFVFWELTSVTSYFLIAFKYNRSRARRAAMQGLMVTVTGGLALLMVAVLIDRAVGTLNISTLLTRHQALLHSPYYLPILLFLCISAFTKSAQWPFHFWLPNAMEAPTPISAFLHSATLVKLGIYLLARFLPILGGTEVWRVLLTTTGGVTMVFAGILFFRETDLKRLLAYSTVMALGVLVLLLGGSSSLSVQAAMAFLLAHALYKGSLFLSAGSIEQCAGTRQLGEMGGLLRFVPVTFVAVALACASLAGIPPLFGFIVKEMVYAFHLGGSTSWLLLCVTILTNAVFVAFAGLLVIKPFFGRLTAMREMPCREKTWLYLCPLVLAVLGLVWGVFPESIDTYLLAPAAGSILQKPIQVELALWHGLTPALLLSIITVAVGVLFYRYFAFFARCLAALKPFFYYGPEQVFHRTLGLLNPWSAQITRTLQTGRLKDYVAWVFFFSLFLTALTFVVFSSVSLRHIIPDSASLIDWLLVCVIILAALYTVIAAPYLSSLVMLSVVGLGTTLIFLLYSAPDVAMTQLLVDIMTVVIVVLAFYRLPRLPRLQSMSRYLMIRNIVIAGFCGLSLTLLMLAVINIPFNRFLSEFYTANSLALARGKNVVNVILVDFRAFDTLGETVVVIMAGLGVFGLLHSFRRSE
jgi:multicomponent Na+:H+ antiporter subunit A